MTPEEILAKEMIRAMELIGLREPQATNSPNPRDQECSTCKFWSHGGDEWGWCPMIALSLNRQREPYVETYKGFSCFDYEGR